MRILVAVLVLAVLALGTLAWDLRFNLDHARQALASRPALAAPLCGPCRCDCPEPQAAPAPLAAAPERRIVTAHRSIESLARACAEGRLTHNGRIGILTED